MHSVERRSFGRIVPDYAARPFVDDQAAGLRNLAARRLRAPRVLAVTSGKGGVGKTNLAVNLALALTERGRRTTLIDLDLGLANADILLDLTPRDNLQSVIAGHKSLSEVALQTPEGLRVVPGASGVERLANLTDRERENLIAGLEELHQDADFILFDTGAGISKNTTAFLGAADDVVVVTTPEPTAVLDAYAVIKLLAAHREHGRVGLVVNMAADAAEAERFSRGVTSTAYRMLNIYVEPLGFVVADAAVPRAVRARRPWLSAAPQAPASRCVRELAQRLAEGPGGSAPGPARVGFMRRLVKALTGD
jgi:flagellar biosynthesis protein FlhG